MISSQFISYIYQLLSSYRELYTINISLFVDIFNKLNDSDLGKVNEA